MKCTRYFIRTRQRPDRAIIRDAWDSARNRASGQGNYPEGWAPKAKIQYFTDTDTLYIEFKETQVAETRDLDENTLLDVDRDGNICGITVEHASQRADIPRFSYEQVAA